MKGIAKFDGCPDSDGDGIPDSEDKCPTVAGIAAFQGCPDTDGDGIPDSEDKCPNVAGIAAFQGCPDTDGDGIPDAEDRCPTEKGPKATMGCPDRDNDGIPDIDDKCPDVPGIAANKGCPEIKEETRKVLAQALKGVQFETAKDVIKPPSFPILDNVVKVMQTNPEYILEINGHTDNQGDAAKNLDLSQRRANSVKVYLVKKGIAENRLIPTGFGQTVPVGDNKTAQGRAINRRVEFHIVF
ncbi:MAG: OmpA family protein [Bacteroidetes bacterium]|nr:OmpA family protein [Bacteroidota bacterium]